MKHSPIALTGIHFTEVMIASTPKGVDADVDKVDLDKRPDLYQSPENKRDWSVTLTVEIKSKEGAEAPYSGEVEAFGFFSVSEKWKESDIEKLVYINGCGIVYAAIREMVTNITVRGFFDPLILPSCSFAEMYGEMEEEKKKQAESAQQAPLNLTSESKPETVSEKSG